MRISFKFNAANLEMTNKSRGILNFRKFPLNGIFPILFFMFFLGLSFFPITAQDLEIKNFENQTTQFSSADSNKTPSIGHAHFVEQIEEKEEEKQEDNHLENSLDAIVSSFVVDRFEYFLLPKSSSGPNFWFNTRIPLYILFQNLKLDLV